MSAGKIEQVEQRSGERADGLASRSTLTVIDNRTVGRLVAEGFFEKLFGPGIEAEEKRKAAEAFR